MTQPTTQNTPQTSSGSGLDPKIAALLCYLICPPIGGIVFWVLEKGNKAIQFHAWQSIVMGALGIAIWFVFFILFKILPYSLIDIFYYLEMLVVGLPFMAVWIICMLKAYQGEKWKIPVLGDIAEKMADQHGG